MRKNTFLSVALLAASVSVVNAQEAPKELFWQNSSNTGIQRNIIKMTSNIPVF